MQANAITDYAHAYTTVDGVLLRYSAENKCLQVYLIQRTEQPEAGKWSLPGGFMDIDERLDETLKRKFLVKTGIQDFYMEQLKTFDALERDCRARVLSVAYLALTNRPSQDSAWFRICKQDRLVCGQEELLWSELAFDHQEILQEALLRLKGKLWYSDLLKYLLPDEFIIRDAQILAEIIEGAPISNFRRKIANRVKATGHMRDDTNGRPAATFVWA